MQARQYPFLDSDVFEIFDDLLEANLIYLPEMKRLEEAKQKNDPKYCKYHRLVGHAMQDCIMLKDKVMQLARQDAKTLYDMFLNSPWLRENDVVPSTWHQCFKYCRNGIAKRVLGDNKPFSEAKSHFVDAKYYIEILRKQERFYPQKSQNHLLSLGKLPAEATTKKLHGLNATQMMLKEKGYAIQDSRVGKVNKLIEVGFIREVKYSLWISSVVPIRMNNGQIRVCVDFRDPNNACPKDEFLLPIVELMIDATVGHETLSFMDGSSGYNQIRMAPTDEELTAFHTPKGIYCYKVMSFGLKNAGATYQRAMQRIFDDMYVDDLVVKSKKREDHFHDLRKANPLKYVMAKPVHSDRLSRWYLQLQQFKITYVSQKTVKGQVLADFLADHRMLTEWELSDDLPDEDVLVIEVTRP
ncbi:hypothetical protein Sango_2298200 [Sesamum angolense]|uniref:Reverse transcriptase domain-containing protein n=1 Tax=Sesamum angolense TaxID=2727404 RepID=A0AAE2BLC3_9LAMI|nr:hypothetical protein Sango_2298200 [Sesamum angolense]